MATWKFLCFPIKYQVHLFSVQFQSQSKLTSGLYIYRFFQKREYFMVLYLHERTLICEHYLSL